VSLVAGIDCSTQATKVLVVDQDDGTVVARGAASHQVSGTGGVRETDPQVWEGALAEALAATGHAGDLRAVAVAAQQHGLVIVDRSGCPLRPAVLWNDTRSAPQAHSLVEALGGPAASATKVGSVLTAAFTVTTWAWLRDTDPGLVAATRGVRLPHDHLTALLTGAAVTDRSDASGTGWWSPSEERYATEVLELPEVQLDPALLPEVLGPQQAAGAVTAEAAKRFGLEEGVLVAAGAGDNAAAALALGLAPGEVALSLGTSGTTFAPADRPSADPTGVVAGFAGADGRYLPLTCTLNATLAVDRVAGWLGIGRDEVEPAGGVVCLPWLDGERTPNLPGASGTFWGLRHDTSRGAILQAVYDGVVATLLAGAAELARWTPCRRIGTLVLIGGGARGHNWRQTVRRLSGLPVRVPECAEPVAYGAAVQAAAVGSGRPPAEVARAWRAGDGPTLEPVPPDEDALHRIAAWREMVTALELRRSPLPGSTAT